MWHEYRVFRCPECGHEIVERFLKMTGEGLHDQWIDISAYARREEAIMATTCSCGHRGFVFAGVRDTR